MEAGGYYNCKKTDGICEDVCDSEVSGPAPSSSSSSFRHQICRFHSPRRVFLSLSNPFLTAPCLVLLFFFLSRLVCYEKKRNLLLNLNLD
jgi:hypothetical protein